MTIDELRKIFPDATLETWHQHSNGGGWVQNTARVDATAFVEKTAQVYGDAQVYGNAWVYGDAWVSGDAWEFSPIQIRGSRNFINEASATVIQIGCCSGTAAWWASNRVKLGKSHGYTGKEIEEYRLYLELIARVRALRAKAKRTKQAKKKTKRKTTR